jgi:hypothetical protein
MLIPAASVKAPPNPIIFCFLIEESMMISWAKKIIPDINNFIKDTRIHLESHYHQGSWENQQIPNLTFETERLRESRGSKWLFLPLEGQL